MSCHRSGCCSAGAVERLLALLRQRLEEGHREFRRRDGTLRRDMKIRVDQTVPSLTLNPWSVGFWVALLALVRPTGAKRISAMPPLAPSPETPRTRMQCRIGSSARSARSRSNGVLPALLTLTLATLHDRAGRGSLSTVGP